MKLLPEVNNRDTERKVYEEIPYPLRIEILRKTTITIDPQYMQRELTILENIKRKRLC